MERDLAGNIALVVREVKLWKYHLHNNNNAMAAPATLVFILLLLNSNVKQELRHRFQTLNTFYYSE